MTFLKRISELLRPWRAHLGRIPVLYLLATKWRKRKQDKLIQEEQRFYEGAALRQGLLAGEAFDETFRDLKGRLDARGIIWPPTPSGRRLHILYASLPGNWERHNFPPDVSRVADVSCFFLTENGIDLSQDRQIVRQQVDKIFPRFVTELHEQKPIDFVVSYLSGAEVSPTTIETIKALGIACFAFHWDDRRAFRGRMVDGQWSGPAAVCRNYDLNLTNSTQSLVKYRVEGGLAIFWPEAANPDFFRPLRMDYKYDVTFCGQRYGVRPILVDYLRKQGIKVDCFGSGWEHGYQTDESLVEIFNQSRINLGFGFVNESGDQCLKARDFEIPSCGAVYLTSHNSDLERVYRIDQEIISYRSFNECVAKIRLLLADELYCAMTRELARAAVLDRHTWRIRVGKLIGSAKIDQD